jgi:hypothetical protein
MWLRLRNRKKRTEGKKAVDENDVVVMTLMNFTALNKWDRAYRA